MLTKTRSRLSLISLGWLAATLACPGCGSGSPMTAGSGGGGPTGGGGAASGGSGGIGGTTGRGGSAGTGESAGGAGVTGGSGGGGGSSGGAGGSNVGGATSVGTGGQAGTAGGDAVAGQGGTAGRGGIDGQGGTAGKGPTRGCLDLSHFDDKMRMKWDLYVIGTGFQADEGNTVRVIVTTGKPSYGLAEAAILNGSFNMVLPGTIEPYTGIGVYIDRNRDDACSIDGDSLWQKTTSAVSGDHVWEITPQTPNTPDAPLCNINGIFDLTVPLPCP